MQCIQTVKAKYHWSQAILAAWLATSRYVVTPQRVLYLFKKSQRWSASWWRSIPTSPSMSGIKVLERGRGGCHGYLWCAAGVCVTLREEGEYDIHKWPMGGRERGREGGREGGEREGGHSLPRSNILWLHARRSSVTSLCVWWRLHGEVVWILWSLIVIKNWYPLKNVWTARGKLYTIILSVACIWACIIIHFCCDKRLHEILLATCWIQRSSWR